MNAGLWTNPAPIALYNIQLLKDLHPNTIVGHFSMIAGIVSFLAMVPSLYVAPREAARTGRILLELIGVGTLGTVGQLAMTRGYMAGDPAIKAIVALARVAFGVGFDILIRNRSFDMVSIIGIILITTPAMFFVAEQKYASHRKSIPATAK
jgi:drug/metabolite transporter (DMT)-like permease